MLIVTVASHLAAMRPIVLTLKATRFYLSNKGVGVKWVNQTTCVQVSC
jgi:hypothetical protein